MMANISVLIKGEKNFVLDENDLRIMILNSIRVAKNTFGREYGKIVIAVDSGNYWRRDLFPYYKHARKKARAASLIDWNAIHTSFKKIKQEINEHFPYRFIEVDRAEADDVIATLVFEYGVDIVTDISEKILIYSGDKDFIQLHTYANVKQYDAPRKRWIENNDPETFLKEHIIRGDVGDGIPNIFSPDNCFVIGQRQTPVSTKKLDVMVKQKEITFESRIYERNYQRNVELIDLSKIPHEIKNNIIKKFESQKSKPKKIINYFMKNELPTLINYISEF